MNSEPTFLYTLKRSRRARRLRLVVRAGGEVEVIAPVRVPLVLIERAVAERSAWVTEKVAYMKAQGPVLTKDELKKQFDDLKERARELAAERLAFFNETYQLTWKQIRMKKSKTRWGSCSKDGNLNFHYRIALLPPHLADYIVVHELCHLAQMNHSAKFWSLVAKTIPDYAARRRAMRTFFLS